MPKPKYVSAFDAEICRYVDPNTETEHRYLLQYDDSKDTSVSERLRVIKKRAMNDVDWKDTPYFEKRGANLIAKLASANDIDELLLLIIKNSNVISSTMFPYRDFLLILDSAPDSSDEKKNTLIRFIRKSVFESGFVAPKIIYLYNAWFGNGSVDADPSEGG